MQVLRLQRAAGNMAVLRLLRLQKDAEGGNPTTERTKPVRFTIGRAADGAIIFRTQSARLGSATVHATGRLAISGTATLADEELPRQRQPKWVAGRIKELAQKALGEATPTAAGNTVELAIGGHTLALELAAAATLPAFQVSGHWSLQGRPRSPVGTFSFATGEVAAASLTLDASIWITPDAAGQSPSGSQATDASVASYTFLGQGARFADPRPGRAGRNDPQRSGTVVTKATLDALNRRLRDETKANSHYQRWYALPEQQMAWLQSMRAYFGNDERTIEHLASIRVVNLKGRHARTWLHEDAASRLEQVEAELLAANESMPTSGGIGWPRSEGEIGGQQGLGNLHNLGYAIDFNAVETPHLTDRNKGDSHGQRTRDLIEVMTGRSPQMRLGQHEAHLREMGDVAMAEDKTPEEKEDYFAAPRQQAFLQKVEDEAKSLSQASEQFRSSLKIVEEANEVDLAERLRSLRKEWFGWRQTRLEAIDKQIPNKQKAITSLQKRLEGARGAARQKKLSDGLSAARKELEQLQEERTRVQTELSAEKDRTHAKWQELHRQLAAAQQALRKAKPAQKEANEKELATLREQQRELVESLELDKILEPWLTKLGAEITRLRTSGADAERLTRLEALELSLADPDFVLGTKYDPVVKAPSATQLVTSGFFTTAEHSKRPQAFTPVFVRTMAKHGFKPGATFSSPDSMHFELRWSGPGR